jgi:hypothetical protein
VITLALNQAMLFLPTHSGGDGNPFFGLGPAAIAAAVVMLGAGIAFRILDSKSPKLPPSIPERTSERHAIVRSAVIILPILASISALDLLGARGYHAAAFTSALLTLLAMPLLFIFYLIARKDDRAASRVVADAWVSWKYDSGEWRRFTDAQSNPQIRRLGKQEPQFFAGSTGILVGDKFVPWRQSGITLKEAARQWGAPDFVSFRFEVSYGKGPVTLELAAPIPPNADRDLRLLHDKLSTSYPSARVKLV